ncbi:Uncharacterised protein (plasmid) [Legionella adelaidensis]|uniref:Uncharacterized protein n=1 Tax=Legionella adelaidensis TaxID=45056 RepID=A0A0W0R454_9GAMM|nr:hypothetical protein [Legionella adelaidensis]KTC65840.1 hypothetical protein Lade_0498 [Legionella adelaidensis]VEH85270.1 Uncharacterised protein [Legionella adelaidensis]
MIRILTLLFITTLSFTANADDALSSTDTQDQQNDQQTCYQQRISDCMNKCASSDASDDCESLCEENSRNECKDAGE